MRLLTMTGPGRVGKASLAMEAARLIGLEFADGVVYAALGVRRSPDLVPTILVRAVGLRDAREPIESLKAHLQDKHLCWSWTISST